MVGIMNDEWSERRRRLAKHVWRMRVKGGCTFEEIARALRCTTDEARKLFKEAMR